MLTNEDFNRLSNMLDHKLEKTLDRKLDEKLGGDARSKTGPET